MMLSRKTNFCPGKRSRRLWTVARIPWALWLPSNRKAGECRSSSNRPGQLTCSRPVRMALSGMFHPLPRSHTEGRDGEGGVFRLIAADEGQTDTVQPVEIEGDGVEVAALHFEAGEIHHRERRVLLPGHTGDDSVRFRHTAVAHHRTARLNDAGLGSGDVRDGGAEFFYMVHAQRRDDRALGRVDDVG